MLAMERCSRLAAVRRASFSFGAMRRVSVAVLSAGMLLLKSKVAQHCNVQYSPTKSPPAPGVSGSDAKPSCRRGDWPECLATKNRPSCTAGSTGR